MVALGAIFIRLEGGEFRLRRRYLCLPLVSELPDGCAGYANSAPDGAESLVQTGHQKRTQDEILRPFLVTRRRIELLLLP